MGALRSAKWPPPSLITGHLGVGVQILAGKNVTDAGKAVQALCDKKIGGPTDFEQPDKMPDNLVEIVVGWQPM